MNHYPRHVGDIISATVGLSLMERGAYSALLDQYYLHEAPLPADIREVYRMAAVTSAAERKAVDYVLGKYFVFQEDGYHQKRCDEELRLYCERCATASASAQSRWSKRNANAMPTHSEGNANHKPVTSNHKEPTTKASAPALPDWMPPEVWQRWARHRGNKLTPQAMKLQIGKLEGLRAQGHDPPTLVDLAIESGWATFYPPRPAPMSSTQDRRAVVAAGHFRDAHESVIRDITPDSKRVA